MALPDIPGICGHPRGSNIRPCKISHVSTYPNQVGIYPSEFLPSTFTLWHATFASQFPLSPSVAPPGTFPIGFGTIEPNAPTIASVHQFQSHHHIIFARTKNHINIPHRLTEADIDTVDELGVAEIDVGEFVFEVVAATDKPMDPTITLTDQEVENLETNEDCFDHFGCSAESKSDREFRKLFEIPLVELLEPGQAGPPQSLLNRFGGIVPNIQGVEYRLDNGTAKSRLALDQSGLGDLDSPSYRDGSSRKIRVQLALFDAAGGITDFLGEGQDIFLTYVAIKEHYMRQRITITWNVFDNTLSGCETTHLNHSIAHYRFYEWDMEPEANSDSSVPPVKLSGWRAVETFNSDVNFVAPIFTSAQISNPADTVLADFAIGAPDFTGAPNKEFIIVPGKISLTDLQAIIDDRKVLNVFQQFDKAEANGRTIGVLVDRLTLDGGGYHLNSGFGGNNTAFRNSTWFTNNTFSKYRSNIEASGHVFFNVHPRALRKRDVDKWGIERFLAVELEKDFSNGRLTSFPFMDDPNVKNPTLFTGGAVEALSASNALFQPIKPVTSYGLGNFIGECASIGSFQGNPADGLNSYHLFDSNRITEKFDTDTRVLVERNFAVNADIISPRIITIEGAGGGSRGAVSCITDPSKEFQFASHTNDDGFLVFHTFSSGYTAEAIRTLSFRPDLPSPPFKENLTPTVDQFERLVGFGSMLGDVPGIQPGRTVALTSSAELSSFGFKTTDPNSLPSFVEDTQVEIVAFPEEGDSPIIIPVENTYYGSITIKYVLDPGGISDLNAVSEYAILLAKLDNIIVGSVDSLAILTSTTNAGNIVTLQADFRWLRASSFELIGERVAGMKVRSILLRAINPTKLNDFLNEEISHTAQFAKDTVGDRKTDRSLFFSANVVSVSEDEHSNLYIFFNDKDGGISVATSTDFGGTWHYYYGIVEKIGDIEAVDPFAVTHPVSNNVFLFYRFGGKVLCKKIPFSLFVSRDSNLIERFSDDVFVAEEEGTQASIPKEGDSIYTTEGRLLRRAIVSNAAAGDLTDEAFLEIVGKVPGEFEYKPNENREIDGETISIRKNPIAIGPWTAFVNINIVNPFFSAYRKDNGELKLWYLAATEDSSGAGELQCNFSVDDGQTWFDLWEFVTNTYRRFRMDLEKKTRFIDRTSSGTEDPTNLEGTDLQEGNQLAQFGINIHWSRLTRHKIATGEGEVTANSESEVLEVSSPYVFYQSTTDRVFLFYIYEGCLLCKVFNDAIFTDAVRVQRDAEFPESAGMGRVQDVIERQTRSYFIDGSLSSSELREEIHGFTQDGERMADGNIIFKYPFAVDNFTEDREIGAQRVCAVDLPTGLVRVFYKHADSVNLKSALWIGSEWWAEDFLHSSANVTEFVFPENSEPTEITGGFGGTGFSP